MGYESTELWLAMKQTKYKRTLAFLKQILRKANGDMDEAVRVTLDTVCDAVHAEAGTFWFYSRFGDGMIHPRAQFGGKPMTGLFLAPGEGIAGQVIEKAKPVLISDCRKDSRWAGRMDEKTGFSTKSMMCVPLYTEDNNSFGCIQLINKTDGSLFDEEDLKLVEALSEEISTDFINLNLISDGKTVDKAAVMFVDIRRFTNICRKLEPVQVANVVNRFLSFVSTVVRNYDGVPNKYIGDCVLTYWDGDDAAEKACKAAVELMQDLPEFRKSIKEKLGCDLQIGIGIDLGSAFVGNIGSSILSDHTIYGNTVNEASYLESTAPAGKIYVSEAVAGELEGKMKFIKVPPLSLKRRKYRINVYSLKF